MPASPAPLLFPQALRSRGLWSELGKTYGLTQKDFEWFSHLQLATHVLRNQQTPPMHAEKITVGTAALSVPLAGCFVLSATPDDNGEILYTPYAGIKKFASRAALSEQIKRQLNDADEEDDLLAFMSLSARKTLAAASDIQVAFETIAGDVFEDQRAVIENNLRANEQAMIEELQKLPVLNTMLDTLLEQLLKANFPGLDQRRTRVNFFAEALSNPDDTQSFRYQRWPHSMSLREALLAYYRHQRWPDGQRAEFTHSQRKALAGDQQHWETAIKTAANDLISQLSTQLQSYWNQASVDGATRRAFFSRAIKEKARAELLLKREDEVITPEQSRALVPLIEPTAAPSGLRLETVRLWENPANYVELAGSLMISQDSSNAFLYTPANGFQVLRDYEDLRATLREKSISAGHDDELYALMTLEERQRFIGFHEPQVSGSVISGAVFTTLFEAIITKQLQNLEYAIQVFRNSDGAVNIQAYFDKALDIRAMIGEQLSTLETAGRWTTRPVMSGEQPSGVLEDTANEHVKTLNSVELPIREEFERQPLDDEPRQRYYLASMKPRLAHTLSVCVRAEAALRELGGTLRNADWHVVDTVFNPQWPDRSSRPAVRGFHPDAFSLVLDCSGERDVVRLANCILLTERGGLDIQHSGRAILWTPGAGLEVFATVAVARRQLNLRLLDPDKRLVLLENLSPAQRKFHRRYALNSLRLIEGDVLQHIVQSGVELFMARCEHVRSLNLTRKQKLAALGALSKTLIPTNLTRAKLIAQAMSRRQSLPGWLGLASIEEQKLHIELLEQYRNSVTDDKDYLHGLQTLEEYVRQTLNFLLTARFPNQSIDPDKIEITPNLALSGPAQTLTQFALNHVNIAQGTGFRVGSADLQRLPEELTQSAINQLLLSLNIEKNYAKGVTDTLKEDAGESRKLRFVQQLPWQLLQHAHALKLQRHLSNNGFDLIRQVLDMPDATARHTVKDAHAIIRPLELIKTANATAVKTLGLYLIGPGNGHKGSHILFAPYRAGPVFAEFDTEANFVAAINTPGELQDLLIRRLPEDQQATFRNLLKSTAGKTSEITLGATTIDGNVLIRLFHDNTRLLGQMFGSQSKSSEQSDWDTVKQVFSSGIRQVSGLLPGKLSRLLFFWQSFKDFEESAEALQNHHWQRALRGFIAGAAEMISLGRLELEASLIPEQSASNAAPVDTRVVAQPWSQVHSTSTRRTLLRHFETSSIQLKDLKKDSSNGTYLDTASKLLYAPIAGKVCPVEKVGTQWQVIKDKEDGLALLATPEKQLVIDLNTQGVRFGKAVSKMHNQFVASLEARQALNIEARGMTDIRAKSPEKADMLVSALDLARFYAFNALHNLSQLRKLTPGTRLDTFFKEFFDVGSVDLSLLDKIKEAILPVCLALVDPDNDLLSKDRLVVGSNKNKGADVIAFTNTDDPLKRVHFSEHFFDPKLDMYENLLTEPFDIVTHSQAFTIIHELSHQASKTVDIAYLEGRCPFSDLIETVTGQGRIAKRNLSEFQRNSLSMRTPREELFARWNKKLNTWIDFDLTGFDHDQVDTILEITNRETIDEARDDFLDVNNATHRINIILRNADSVARLICEMGRQLDPVANP